MADKNLILAALGSRKANLAILNGQLVNVMTEEIYQADVAIYGSKIVAIGKVDHCIDDKTTVLDAKNKYLLPGLIDAHIHPEVSKLSMTKFAEAVIPRGTTVIMTGLDQVGVVAGIRGMRLFLDEAKKTPLRVFHVAPSKLPYTIPPSTISVEFGPKQQEEAFRWSEAVGLWETTIDFVLGFDRQVSKSIDLALAKRLTVQGHCPLTTGKQLAACISAGMMTDHESIGADEALEKLRNGLGVIIREGTVAHNLVECIKALTSRKISTRKAMLCTDDIDVTDIVNLGHMDHLVRLAIKEGVDPMNAIQMATINAAQAYRVDHIVGSIGPGKAADVLIVDDPSKVGVEKVVANGELVAADGKMLVQLKSPTRPAALLKSFHMKRPLKPEDMTLKTNPKAEAVKVLSMAVPKEIPFRFKREAILKAEHGVIKPDLENDVLYVTVVERYRRTGNKSLAFISGFSLKTGAIATSLSPDDNNVVCIGTNEKDMAFAVNYIAKVNGAQVAVKDERVIASIHLPICGIVADVSPQEMAKKEQELRDAARSFGCTLDHPFDFMIFIPITAIPEYALTDRGLVESRARKFVNPIISVT